MARVVNSTFPPCQSQGKCSSHYPWQQDSSAAEPPHRPNDSLLPSVPGAFCSMKEKEKEEAVAFHDPRNFYLK